MRKIFKDLMYKRGHDYDYQYDWVLKKAGKKIDEADYADAKVAGNIAAVQGKDDDKKPNNKFTEERKENRAMLGQQVVNGSKKQADGPAPRQGSAKKKPVGNVSHPIYGRGSANGWGSGQLPVAMQH